jgi:hypothetical protein
VGTSEVFAVYDYVDFGGGRAQIVVDGPGIPDLYASPTERLFGSGTDAVRIGGADILLSLTDVVLGESSETRANVRKARTQSAVYGYLEMILLSTRRIERCMSLIATLAEHGDVAGDPVENMDAILVAAVQIATLAQEAFALPSNDLEGKQALAGQMEDPAQRMIDNAEPLSAYAATVSEIMLPETGADQVGFIVVAEIGRLPCMSAEFSIAGEAPAQ